MTLKRSADENLYPVLLQVKEGMRQFDKKYC